MHAHPYKQVDVFTATPYLGNPLAVALDSADLSDRQRILVADRPGRALLREMRGFYAG